jgi:hypothetical protein
MATTTNYGWTTPDDTSLVKDGASAIRTLGSSIDTSLNNALGTKKAGLVLLNTTSFSGVSSQSIGSDAAPLFTSAYKNYRIFVSGEGSTSTYTDLFLRLRANTTDATAADYYRYLIFRTDSSGSDSYTAPATSWSFGFLGGQRTIVSGDISYPQVNDFTSFTSLSQGMGSSTSIFVAHGGYHNVAAQYNGMTLFPSSGTMTGEVSIYGYNA